MKQKNLNTFYNFSYKIKSNLTMRREKNKLIK